ncbi:MAG: NRDE family protein, partial [Pseudomonadota bacterium]|nr:NRDE family protein [Pseudomonadota bacterium]
AMADVGPLLTLLRDDSPAPDEELPSTGVGLERERLLSSAFVRAGEYGTRCSTVIRVDRRGDAFFDEWTWDTQGENIGRVSLRFAIT